MTIGLGGYIVGSEAPVEGRIRNLNIYQTGEDGIACTYAHEGFEEGQHHTLVYINGRLAAVSNTGIANATGLTEGYQNINVVPQLVEDGVSEIYYDEQDGRRVLLEWTPSAQDIAGYRIHSTGITGNNPVEIATVIDKMSPVINYDFPHAGAGLGRISSPSTMLPDTAFGSITITITGNSQATYTYNAEPPVPITFYRGAVTYLSHNIPVFWHDDFENYVTGDTWIISTGIHPSWLSDDLTPGSYRYGVSSYDGNGNESAITLTQVFEVVDQAEPVTGEVVTWDADNFQLNIAFPLPEGAATVRLYSNFNQTEGSFEEYVQIQPSATGTEEFNINFGFAQGTFLYYLMPVTNAGAELQDFTLRKLSVPLSPSDLGNILGTAEAVEARSYGIHNWQSTWRYFYEKGDTLTNFTMHRVATGSPFTLDSNDLVATISAGSTGHGFASDYSFIMAGETAAATLDICIVAHNAHGDTTVSETVTITTIGVVTIDAPSDVQGGTV